MPLRSSSLLLLLCLVCTGACGRDRVIFQALQSENTAKHHKSYWHVTAVSSARSAQTAQIFSPSQ